MTQEQPSQPQEDTAETAHKKSLNLSAAFEQAGTQLRRKDNGHVDVLHAVGGIRGLAEAALPGLVFLILFMSTEKLFIALDFSLGVAGIFAFLRLLQRDTLMQALSGFIGVLICAIVSYRSGSATEFYTPGLYLNLIYGVVVGASIVVRWPILGLFYSYIRGEQGTWRQRPERLRAYNWATIILCAMFFVRLAVQVPLYQMDAVAALGIARLVMGIPLYSLVLWISWVISKPQEQQTFSA
ncbi:DUF3159 domain-containing protein [Rothia sp. P7208]|uniref:DUF3159 domain-containing protein n=1 Tax=Rothia sp. P7208 TaxID=3402660 RepID=UPI003AC06863